MKFKLASDYEPRGDQPEAIAQLVRGVNDGDRHQVLLGVTGSGESLDSISLATGLLISSTQTSTQNMDYRVTSASTGSSVHHVGKSQTQTEITLVPDQPERRFLSSSFVRYLPRKAESKIAPTSSAGARGAALTEGV